MKKLFSPRDAYNNYWDYLSNRLFRTKVLFAGAMAYLVGLAFIIIAKLLQNYGSSDKLDLPNHYNLIDILINLFFVFSLFFVLTICASVLIWLQKFEFIDGKIVDYFPRKQSFEISDIERIVLMTPKMAHILMKRPGDSLIQIVYWFGRTEEEWISFLTTISASNKEISDKIYYAMSPKVGASTAKSTIHGSYTEVKKVFKGVNKY